MPEVENKLQTTGVDPNAKASGNDTSKQGAGTASAQAKDYPFYLHDTKKPEGQASARASRVVNNADEEKAARADGFGDKPLDGPSV